MPAVVVRPTPESVRLDATTPAPRNRPEVAPEHLEVDAEISRDGEDSVPPSKPRLNPQPTARMTSRTAVRNQRFVFVRTTSRNPPVTRSESKASAPVRRERAAAS